MIWRYCLITDNAPVYRDCLSATPYHLPNTVLPQHRRMKITIIIAIIVTVSDPKCSKRLMSDEHTDIVIHHYSLWHILPITRARRTGCGHNTCPRTRLTLFYITLHPIADCITGEVRTSKWRTSKVIRKYPYTSPKRRRKTSNNNTTRM